MFKSYFQSKVQVLLFVTAAVTIVVIDSPVSVQNPSSVPDDVRPRSSTHAKQEGTAAEPVTVSVEVHEVLDADQDVDNVSESPLTALARMTFGTQTGSDLPHQKDPPQPPLREVGEDAGRYLTLNPARPLAELVGQMRAHLLPT